MTNSWLSVQFRYNFFFLPFLFRFVYLHQRISITSAAADDEQQQKIEMKWKRVCAASATFRQHPKTHNRKLAWKNTIYAFVVRDFQQKYYNHNESSESRTSHEHCVHTLSQSWRRMAAVRAHCFRSLIFLCWMWTLPYKYSVKKNMLRNDSVRSLGMTFGASKGPTMKGWRVWLVAGGPLIDLGVDYAGEVHNIFIKFGSP